MTRDAAVARRVLVLGGTSEIGGAIVEELAARGPCAVMLAGRDAAGLQGAAARLAGAGCAPALTAPLEAGAREGHREALAGAIERLGGADLVILAVGVLGERGGLPADIPAALEVLEVNTVGAGSLLLHSARLLAGQGHGTIVVLSSVAARRPRAANVVYGASKAGLDALAQGLADAMAGSGVRVMVVRPGFVHTRMTRGLSPPPLATDARTVARATLRGLDRGAGTVWAPRLLAPVAGAMALLPRPLWRRLAL